MSQAQVSNWCPNCEALATENKRFRDALVDVTRNMSIDRCYFVDAERLCYFDGDRDHAVTGNPATIATVRELREGKDATA